MRAPRGIPTWGGAPGGGGARGTIHWVSATHAVDAEVRLYDRLFQSADRGEGGRPIRSQTSTRTRSRCCAAARWIPLSAAAPGAPGFNSSARATSASILIRGRAARSSIGPSR